MNENIVSIATSTGLGAICIVRLSGINALEIAQKITKKSLKPRYAHLCKLHSKTNDLIDEAIVIFFKSPKSYTAQDLVEFQTHGGSAVANTLIDEILGYENVRLARAGEFTKRAILNGKMSIEKAELLSQIVLSKSKHSAKILARQLSGGLLEFVEKSRQNLLKIIAHTEVCIDYSEENLPDDVYAQINQTISKTLGELNALIRASLMSKASLDGIKVAIVGKPNVGKSSLLNKLLNYERAIVSTQEGTTRDSIEAQLIIDDFLIKIIDTAGLRKTSQEVEQQGINQSKSLINKSDLNIALFDASRTLDESDYELLELLKLSQTPCIFALSKTDLTLVTTKILDKKLIKISQNNIEDLLAAIKNELKNFDFQEESILTSTRQTQITQKIVKELQQAQEMLQENALELVSFHTHEAISLLAEISKPINFEEVLDTMFGDFCLGK